MIRCRHEVIENVTDKKHEDSRELAVIAPRRLSFDDLVRRDGSLWNGISDVNELRRIAGRVQRELAAGQFAHFVAWVCEHQGAGLARAAGLPIAPLRLSMAS